MRASYSLLIGLITISYCHSSYMHTIVTPSPFKKIMLFILAKSFLEEHCVELKPVIESIRLVYKVRLIYCNMVFQAWDVNLSALQLLGPESRRLPTLPGAGSLHDSGLSVWEGK